MKRFKNLWILFFLAIFFLNYSVVGAQVSQNIILSCLDPTTITPDPQTINNKTVHHLINLKNREQGVFSPSQPVYVIRSLARVFCNPNDNDPECVKDSQNRISPCIQEKIGANICNQDCPWGNHTCSKNNAGVGNTVCCMPLYTKQGPYFECANDINNKALCPANIMSQEGQNNGIHPSENGHIETGYESSFMLVEFDSKNPVSDPEGNIFINIAQDYTRAGLDHGFYGMQVLSDQAITNNEAFRYSLKLALFTQTEITEPSAVNCTTIYWDPYGKVIDSLRLEPVYNLPILLKNLDPQGNVVNTTVSNNPAFKNPEPTDLAGNFNFAVPAGTYFLEPITALFNFPVSGEVLTTVLNNLQGFDPNQEYINRDKIYNNLTEPIIEQEGFSERRDIILEPKDPNYQGSSPVIMYAENLRHEGSQLIRGRASHPKSIIKIYLDSVLVGQVEADIKGGFSTIIPQSVIDNNPGQFTIYAEKTPILQTNKDKKINNKLFSFFVGSVLAQQPTTSPPYFLSLVPVRMTGFVFDNTIQVQPNSIVQLTVPSLGGISYSQTISDENGYINISQENLPPLNFVLLVTNPQQKQNYQLTINDFNKTNSVFFAETGESLYNTKTSSIKPSVELVKKVHAQTPKVVSPSALSINQQQSRTQNNVFNNPEQTKTSNQVFVFVFLLMLLVVVLVGVIIVKRRQNKDQIYY